MKMFTIDTDNNITFHASRKAARETGVPVFASEVEFADLIGNDKKRLVEIWNSLPGVTPVTKFAGRKVATERIWKAVQCLGEGSGAAPAPEAQVGAAEPDIAPAAAESTNDTTPANKAPKAKKAPKPEVGPRKGTKAAQVVAMLKRPNGATLSEIMQQMGWLKHTCRGFIAGAVKRAGYTVESFLSEKGDRTYRVNV